MERWIMFEYIGNGKFVRGIPARDLTDEEVKRHGKKRLLKTGLYKQKRTRKKPILKKAEE
jgi:hypothetical protein